LFCYQALVKYEKCGLESEETCIIGPDKRQLASIGGLAVELSRIAIEVAWQIDIALQRTGSATPTGWCRALEWFLKYVARLVMNVWVVLGLAALAAGAAGPLQSALQIGMDEHFEVIKGLVWAKGFSLFAQVWNDQPPLHTVLLGLCFKSFGATIGVARTLAVAFGLSLLAACWVLMWRRCGIVAALLSTVSLLVAPQVFELSVSVMLEVPAIGTALWALWPLLQWQEKRRWPWLALSGVLLAAALQIKLTAAVAAPALAVEVLLRAQGLTEASRVKEAARALGIWGGSMARVYLGLAAVLGTVPLEVLWASHFSAQTLAHAGGSAGLPFLAPLWFDHVEAVWSAGAGLLLLVWRRDWRRMAFPLVWLLTVMLVHLEHRPWWSYYYLHFAVPLAWLSGHGIAELLRIAWAMPADRALWVRLQTYGCIGFASLLLALVVAYGGDRLIAEVERIRELPRVEESALVAKMRQYADRTRWVYARQNIYAFHAGLTVVPEVAVLPRKRFWSGQITNEQIWATVKRYRPEQLLLGDGPLDVGIREFVQVGYTRVYEDGANALYVAKSLMAHEH
jgi:4-amino-4-deoxy-L-arabinose transferase-like glycosyltransferase